MSSWSRFGRLCEQNSLRQLVQWKGFAVAGVEAQRQGAASGLQQVRRASGGHHGPGVTYEGLTLHKPAKWHSTAGTAFASLMWFWVFVRAYHDGGTLLNGHAAHFEHEAHDGQHSADHAKSH